MNELVWADDDGFGDGKQFDGEYTSLLPNFIKPIGRTYSDNDDDDINPDERIIAEVHNVEKGTSEKFIVGLGALNKEKGTDWNGAVEFKHLDADFKPFLSTSLCLMAENHPEEVDLDMLVMGLPVNEHEKMERKKYLKDLAIGEHKVTITKGRNEPFTRSVFVKDVLIYKQPMGTIYYYVFDEEGKFRKDSIADDFNVVSDIGARTHNIYACKQMRTEDDYLDNSESGIYSAYEFVRDQLANEGIHVTVSQIVARLDTKKVGDFDFSGLLDRALHRLASTIIRELSTKVQQSRNTINRIIFTGGGSEVLKAYLLPMAKQVFKRQEIVWGDRFTTVKGYRNAGVRAVRSAKKTVTRGARRA